MTPPWYHWLLFVWYRVVAWTPVVMRRGTYEDMKGDMQDVMACSNMALSALEREAEDGIHEARGWLYEALTYGT